MNKVYKHEDLERKNFLLTFKSKEEIVDMLLWYEKENKHNQEIIIKDTSVLKEIRECIMSFLLTEDYIIVDGKAIANNYHKLLEIIDKGLKVGDSHDD